MTLWSKHKGTPPPPPPRYDHAREHELIMAGDMEGWRNHVGNREFGGSIVDLIIYISETAALIREVQRENSSDPLGRTTPQQ